MKYVLFIFLLLIPSLSHAFTRCECGTPEPFDRMTVRAFAIFTGTVVRVTREINPDRQRVDFSVQQSWKGAKYPVITVFTEGTDLVSLAREGLTCGYRFRVGEQYLIFSFRDKDERGPSSVSKCAGIYPLNQAGPMITVLGQPTDSFTSKLPEHRATASPSTVREATSETQHQTSPATSALPTIPNVMQSDAHQKLSQPVPSSGGVNDTVPPELWQDDNGTGTGQMPESASENAPEKPGVLMPDVTPVQPQTIINHVPIY